jgi:hypothetical protein
MIDCNLSEFTMVGSLANGNGYNKVQSLTFVKERNKKASIFCQNNFQNENHTQNRSTAGNYTCHGMKSSGKVFFF